MHIVDAAHHVYGLVHATDGAFDFFVTRMAHHHQVMALACVFLNLRMHLGDQGTGGVDGLQATLPGGMNHRARDAMRSQVAKK